MKKIKLTQGQYALIDDNMFGFLNQWKWCANWNPRTKSFYAVRNLPLKNGKQTLILMHRTIMNSPARVLTDHINHNTLDNRRENLRFATYSQNGMNRRKQLSSISNYKGVRWHKETKKWQARIKKEGKLIHLGLFLDIKKAAYAYNQAAEEMFGAFAYLNKI